MSAIQNLQPFDPFADASKGDDLLPAGTEDYIHIRIQQRNGRKTLTTVQGIADDYDKKKLVKAFKKVGAAPGASPGGGSRAAAAGGGGELRGQVFAFFPTKNPFSVTFFSSPLEICLQWYCDRTP
uniref:Eukaryotic translation initiation factor 1 n=1 Tax=Cairina moschata TaxID=8855 RepID=A0A8C3BRG4_CAIMO